MTTATAEKKNSRPSEAASAAIDDLKHLVRDAEKILSSAGGAAEDKITDLQDRMRGALEASRTRLQNLKASAREHIDEYDHYVHAHPYQSIGVAAAVGALVGLLVGRRLS